MHSLNARPVSGTGDWGKIFLHFPLLIIAIYALYGRWPLAFRRRGC